MEKITAGYVCFGEVNTPVDLIEKQNKHAQGRLRDMGLSLVAADIVRDDPAGKEAERAIARLKETEFDLLVVCISGWIPSWAVIKVTDAFSHLPMLLWGLRGWREGERWVTTAGQAGTSALRKVFEDLEYRFQYIYDTPDGDLKNEAILSFARAAAAVRRLRGSKVGMMGYRDMRLYGTMFDGTSLRRVLGVEIEFFEMLEAVQRIEGLDNGEIASIVAGIEKNWTFTKPAQRETLEKGSRYYLAIRDIVIAAGYEALSLIDVDGMKKLADFPPSMIFMLLGENQRLPTVPENDALGAVTQLIVRYITGQIAPYMEFYEFFEDRLLMGVPDYVPSEVVDGAVTVTPTSFGGFGEGILNVSKVKTGRVTLARLTSKGDRYAMHFVSGQAVTPGAWEEAGWQPPAPQLPSLEVITDEPVEEFTQKVLSQHYIIAYGDYKEELRNLCRLLEIAIL